MSYKYDVFISYKWGQERREWIDKIFVPILKDILYEEDPKFDVFKDTDNITFGDQLDLTLKYALSHSKCMISILSKPYFTDSNWCPLEFSAILYREEKLNEGKSTDFEILVFPIVFVNNPSKNITEKCALYEDEELCELIMNRNPLELDIDKYNNVNKAFREGEAYNKLKKIIRRFVRKSIVPRLKKIPAWKPEWATEIYITEPYNQFKEKYKVGKNNSAPMTNPRIG